MEQLNNVRINRINYPKGNMQVVGPGIWTVGTISTGIKKRGKYESIGFLADQNVNTGIDIRAKYNLSGYYQNDKYGRQFVIQQMQMILDTKTLKGLEQALSLIMSDLIAKRMVEHFGTPEAVIEAFENRYSTEFLKIKGVTETKLDEYFWKFDERISGQEAILALTPLGFTPKQAKDIYKKYGDIELIMEMLDNAGMYDFYLDDALKLHEAETIGRAKKIDSLNVKRIGAWIISFLKKPFQNDSYLTYDQMNKFVVPYLINNCGDGLNEKHYYSALTYLKEKDVIFEGLGKIGLKVIHDTEFSLRETIQELYTVTNARVSSPMHLIEDAISNAPFELSDEQSDAVTLACINGVSIISGNAGAGKSTTLGIITKIFKNMYYSIDQVALSGKAALRIAETTGLPAQTIHRLFATTCRDENGALPDLSNPYLDVTDMKFTCDVLILDEASMVGGAIMLNLLRVLAQSPNIKHVIIVGDDAQLPPIGVGQAFTDFLNYSNLPKAKLTKVYRQASESGVLASATMIRKNQNFLPKLAEFGNDFKHLNSAKGPEWIAEFDRMLANNNGDLIETQIIAMTNLDITKINVALQKHLKIFSMKSHEGTEEGIKFKIYEGSKVMPSKNQYKNLTAEGEAGGDPVFNGNIGIVKQIHDEYMVIDFAGIGEVGIIKSEWKTLRLGYAITIHKSQGSGFNSVIAIVSDKVQEMLTSNMMYTAITRTKNECTLISRGSVVEKCANKSAAERQTWLPIFYGGKK
ncbi:AAA family ATPase [Peribacillus frigoritolerans]|uniref:AAA family ATPase n=1 Tax=Peribacillus frigoritolerans TaxID=450367 RepID=UPI0038302F3C